MDFLVKCWNIWNKYVHTKNNNSLSSNHRNPLFVPNGLVQNTPVFYETNMGLLFGPCCMTINTVSKLALNYKLLFLNTNENTVLIPL